MRQVFLEKDSVVVRQVCQPMLDDCSILVCVYYSCITSGAEIDTILKTREERILSNVPQKIKKMMEYIGQHGIRNSTSYVKNNVQGSTQPLGYSCSGRVIAIGKKIKTIKVGDWVACMGAEHAHHAEIVCVPETHCVPLLHNSSLKYASLVAPGALALQAVRRAQLSLGETVAVIGLDLFGQLALQMVKNSGAIPYAIDIVQERLKLAHISGARAVLNGSCDAVAQQINLLTQYNGVDVTIITANAADSDLVKHAVHITRKRGKIIIAGSVDIALSREHIQEKEIDILLCSSLYDPAILNESQDNYPLWHVRWTQQRNMKTFIDCIEQGALSLQLLIDELPIEDIAIAYNCIADKKKSAIIISYNPEPESQFVSPAIRPVLSSVPTAQDSKQITFLPALPDHVGVGVVGLHQDTITHILPNVSAIKGTRLVAFCDEDMTKTTQLTKWYSHTSGVNNYESILSNELIDLVIIGGNYKNGSSVLLQALAAGKAVFLNGPLATSLEELQEISSFLQQYPQAPLCVNYYRSFSSFIQKIKATIQKRITPLMISYRINFNNQQSHAINSEIAGVGRIITYIAPIIDACMFITDAQPLSLSVDAISAYHSSVFPTDNVAITVRFTDGSVCSIIGTTLGHAAIGSERLELFCEGKSIVMEDYLSLTGWGFARTFNETAYIKDTGHGALVKQFIDRITHKPYIPVISVKRLLLGMQTTLIIDQLACEGGGEKNLKE